MEGEKEGNGRKREGRMKGWRGKWVMGEKEGGTEGGMGSCSQGMFETWMQPQDVARNPKALSPAQGSAMPEGQTWGKPHHTTSVGVLQAWGCQ